MVCYYCNLESCSLKIIEKCDCLISFYKNSLRRIALQAIMSTETTKIIKKCKQIGGVIDALCTLSIIMPLLVKVWQIIRIRCPQGKLGNWIYLTAHNAEFFNWIFASTFMKCSSLNF